MEKKNPLVWGSALRFLIIILSIVLKTEGSYANPYYDGILDFGDIKFVWEKYGEWIWKGFIPYVDFNVEFPPLFVLIIMIPFFFFKIFGIFPYEIWFAINSMIADLLILKILKDIHRKHKMKESFEAIIWIWALFPPIPLLLLTRFDSWPILFLLLAIKFDSEDRFLMASLMATFGTLMKFFPAIYLVALAAKIVKKRASWRSSIVGIILGLLPMWLLLMVRKSAADGLIWMIQFHLGKYPYSASFMGMIYILLEQPEIFKTFFSLIYLSAIIGSTIIKPDEEGIFYSLSIFAFFNWHYTPQYFLWPLVFGYFQSRRRLFLLSGFYLIAFCVQTYVNIFTYTVPGYLPSLN